MSTAGGSKKRVEKIMQSRSSLYSSFPSSNIHTHVRMLSRARSHWSRHRVASVRYIRTHGGFRPVQCTRCLNFLVCHLEKCSFIYLPRAACVCAQHANMINFVDWLLIRVAVHALNLNISCRAHATVYSTEMRTFVTYCSY